MPAIGASTTGDVVNGPIRNGEGCLGRRVVVVIEAIVPAGGHVAAPNVLLRVPGPPRTTTLIARAAGSGRPEG